MSSKALPLQHFWSPCSLTKRRDGTSERRTLVFHLARTQKTARGVRRSQKSTARAKPELRWVVGGQDGWQDKMQLVAMAIETVVDILAKGRKAVQGFVSLTRRTVIQTTVRACTERLDDVRCITRFMSGFPRGKQKITLHAG